MPKVMLNWWYICDKGMREAFTLKIFICKK